MAWSAFWIAVACSRVFAKNSTLPERVNRRAPIPTLSAMSVNFRRVTVLKRMLDGAAVFTVNRCSPDFEMCSTMPAPWNFRSTQRPTLRAISSGR